MENLQIYNQFEAQIKDFAASIEQISREKTEIAKNFDNEKAVELIKNAKSNLKKFEEFRKPITQELDRVKKEFTSLISGYKAEIDAIEDCQRKWKSEQLEIQRKNAAKNAFLQNLELKMNEILLQNKTMISNLFQNASSSTLLEQKENFLNPPVQNYLPIAMDDFTAVEFEQLKSENADKIAEIQAQKQDDFKEFCIGLANQIDERVKLLLESERDFLSKCELEKQNEQLQNDLELSQANAKIVTATVTNDIKIKTAFEISVKNKAGYAEVFNFWWINEGQFLTDDEIKRKSVDQCITFANQQINRNGLRMKSVNVDYMEVVK